MHRTTLALCMIVKDEASIIAECLESAQSVVDEIVVIDTGSTDDTIAISRSYGANVFHDPWRNDFSRARNLAKENATSDWIMWLDADEILDKAAHTELRKKMDRGLQTHKNLEGIYLKILNYLNSVDEEEKETEHILINSSLRMVKNRPQYRFVGRVHEQILPSITTGNPEVVIGEIDVKIHHRGYLYSRINDKAKIERNKKLIQISLQEEPHNAFHWYNLGVEFFRNREFAEALVTFQKSMELQHPNESLCYTHLRKYELVCLEALGKENELIEQTEETLRLFPDFTDIYHIKANYLIKKGEIRTALATFKKALQIGPPPPSRYVTIQGIGSYLTCLAIGELYEKLGEYEEALSYHGEALQRTQGKLPQAIRGIINIFYKRDSLKKLPNFLKKENLLWDAHAKEIWRKIIQSHTTEKEIIELLDALPVLSTIHNIPRGKQEKKISHEKRGK
ncbi:glycosyltransferase [Pasteuria penetrans]|uniref:glycosyltransferase n=1 Tax=Pasteuria penetrans TaxID=86005 RepID=UPI00165BAE77|nr:glycosyltransferase [Pasteuria penetrans]